LGEQDQKPEALKLNPGKSEGLGWAPKNKINVWGRVASVRTQVWTELVNVYEKNKTKSGARYRLPQEERDTHNKRRIKGEKGNRWEPSKTIEKGCRGTSSGFEQGTGCETPESEKTR